MTKKQTQARFRKALKDAKRTRADIAAELGITTQYLSMLASGRRSPSLKLAVEVQRVLGIPAYALLGVSQDTFAEAS